MTPPRLILTSTFIISTLTSASFAAIPRMEEIRSSPVVNTVQAKRRSKLKRKKRLRRRDDRPNSLPQAHIDYCNRQNMDYRVSDNSIRFDRWTRGQCYSPFFN